MASRLRQSIVATSILGLVCSVLVFASPASAQETEPGFSKELLVPPPAGKIATDAASLVASSAPAEKQLKQSDLQTPQINSDGTVVFVTEGDTPGEAQGIILNADAVTSPGSGVSVGLPEVGQSSVPSLGYDSTVVFEGAADNSDLVITSTSTEEGHVTSIFTVIPDSHASREYRYSISGGPPRLRDDGGIDIYQTLSVKDIDGVLKSGEFLVGKFASPWATDANGKSISTHYEIDASTVVQVVDFTPDTAFPVVADPQWWQVAISVTVGTAVGTAVAILLKVPGWGAAIAGCVIGGMNAMWDGQNFWGTAWSCLLHGSFGRLATTIKNLVTKFMADRGYRV